MKIESHELYKKIIAEYPWLIENAANGVVEEEYRKHFKFDRMNWYPYVFYYDMSVLHELKDNLVTFTAVLAGQAFVLRALFQLSPNTHAYAFFVKHPHDANASVVYFDFHTNKNSELIDFVKKHQSYEHTTTEKLGFALGIPSK